MSIRVGFASGDGRNIDQCLTASTGCWWIYDIDDTAKFVKRRVLSGACDGKCTSCSEDPSRYLLDCDLLFVTDLDTDKERTVVTSYKNVQVIRTKKTVRDLTDEIISCVRQKFSPDYFKRVCGFLAFL